MRASERSTMPAVEEAYSRACLITLAGSTTPVARRSSTCSVVALKPKLPFFASICSKTREASNPVLVTICLKGASQALKTI